MSRLSPALRFWLLCTALVLALVAWMAWPRPRSVEVAIIDRGEVTRHITEEGRTRVHDLYTVAAPVAGLLKRVKLEPGDPVAKGAVVASIAPAEPGLLDTRLAAEAAASVTAAQATLAAAEADLELARQDEARTKALFDRGFAAQAALDRARASLRSATALAGQRKAELGRALAAQGKMSPRTEGPTLVRSPVNGKVLRVLQESESVITSGVPILEIGNPADIEVVADFLSQDAALIREGADVIIDNWGGAVPLSGKVHAIEPYARTKVSALGVEEQRVTVIVHLTGGNSAIRPQLGHGFRVDMKVIVFRQQDAVRAPTDALIRQVDNSWAVFRVVDGLARLTRIEIGEGDDHFRTVTAGLNTGDSVVVFPGDALRDGDAVKIRER